MHSIKKLLFLLILMPFLNIQFASACEINITAGDVEQIKVRQEIIITITVNLTHKNCKVSPEETKIEVDGVKILAATKWKETAPGKLDRKLKIEAERTGEVSISASRTCKKEGGKDKLLLTAVQ